MTGTEMGLITVMYSAQKGFTGGFSAFHIAIIAGIVTLLVGLSGFIVEGLRKAEVLTIPEYYEQRYSRPVRIVGGITLALGGILNMGLFLAVGAKFLVGVTGLTADSWALPVVMTALLVLVLVYTVLGGMISVIITDYIQFVVLSIGLVVTTLLSIQYLGWDTIFETVHNRMGVSGFDPLAKGSEFGLDYVVWMAILGLVSCAIWPTAVARALVMESPQAVKRQFTWSSISFTIRFIVPYFWGICAFVFLATKASPELAEAFWPTAEGAEGVEDLYAMPAYLGRLLPTGLLGLITAAMLAAFMSTHDSYLLCWSSVITQDIVAPIMGDSLSAKARIRLTRVLIVLIGIYVWAWGIFYTGDDDIWDYMAVTGGIYFTGAMPLLIGGLYWKRASSAGAMCALITGLSAIFGLKVAHESLENWIQVNSPNMYELLAVDSWTGPGCNLASVVLTTVVFIAVSLAFPDRPRAQATQLNG